MAVSDDLINFDLIETHKENIQSLPGGRSARQLASILSPLPSAGKGPKTTSSTPQSPPTLDETKTLNTAIRAEYELELSSSLADSDDPLDVYDRYVKWTLNAYPSAQATPASQLLPLLERATKAFLHSQHYKNDPRYLKLWLHYIRLFSDAPRETFAFLARHGVGEGLGLFYEEFAGWLEGVGRWAQAEEVYRLGVEREARPVERLSRRYRQFRERLEARRRQDQGGEGGGDGPSSPALPTVRPALAAKVDPFASTTPRSDELSSLPHRPASGGAVGGGLSGTSRSGKPKMAIFSDASNNNDTPPQATTAGTETNGWDSIGSLQERKKENSIAARPWAGETLKAGKKAGTSEPKMTIFRDTTTTATTRAHDSPRSTIQKSSSRLEPATAVAAAVVNPKTGKAERVFVNLEAVYPTNHADESVQEEFSFEELRAIRRGWAARDWRRRPQLRPASPLRVMSINVQPSLPPRSTVDKSQAEEGKEDDRVDVVEVQQKLASMLDDENSVQLRVDSASQILVDVKETKPAKVKRIKVREIKQEVQTVQTKLESPTGPKLKRKNSAEPTMTFHSKAATDEVYNMFNQPSSRHETAREESDDDDDDYSTAGESTGTGRISGTTSEFGDEDTMGTTGEEGDENTSSRTGSQPDGSVSVSPWSEFTASKHVPKIRGGRLRNMNIVAGEEATVTESLVSSSQNQTQTSQLSGFDTQAIAAIAGQQIGELDTQVIAAMAGDFGDEEEDREEREEEEVEEVKTPISPTRQEEEIEIPNKPRYVPLPPEDYEPMPLRPFRDPAAVAQNRLPFMTPIVEKTESSLAPSTVFDDKDRFGSKTPSRSNHMPASTKNVNSNNNSPSRLQIDELILNTPNRGSSSPLKRKLSAGSADLQALTSSPQKPGPRYAGSSLAQSPRRDAQPAFAIPQPAFVKSIITTSTNTVAKLTTHAKGPVIQDLQCNPVDASIRKQILASIHPPLSSHAGFFDNSSQRCGKYPQIQNFTKKLATAKVKSSPRKSQSDRTVTQAVQPILELAGSSRIYAIKRELGKGAFAPVYLAESHERDSTDEDDGLNQRHSHGSNTKRQALEAIKTEDPPSAWEFYILRLLRHRLGHMSRTMQSIILAHECHVFADECYLVLEYRSQGTLLDLVNAVKEENRKAGKPSADVGLDEVLAMFLSVELLRTVEACHRVGVLHGDLKADNCLCRFDPVPGAVAGGAGELSEPYRTDGSCGWDAKGLTLIDFGRGIDFRAFRPEVKFVADWASCAQDCAEIREARPWTWQIDYFGTAGVIHSLLFGRYIETVPVGGGGGGSGLGLGLGEKKEWKLKENFKRYWASAVWGEVFGLLLNPTLGGSGGGGTSGGGGGVMPCLAEMKRVREGMERWLEEEGERKGLRAAVRRAEVLLGARSSRK